MADEADWLPDLAALASLSVAVHYVLGIYGLLGALLLFVLLEHGAALSLPLAKTVDADERTPSTPEDDASTEGDDDLRPADAPEDDAPQPPDEQEQDEELQRRQRAARQHTASLVVSDVASVVAPPDELQMNARTPVSFETQLFQGRALFLVRTQPEDPHYAALFAGKRRMFWIQVQGRFKKAPQGPVYLGGELPARIAPGVFTRSIALVIMGLIRRLVGRVSFSFGGDADSDNSDELPAVAFPLYQSVDQFVETPEGETPPELGTGDFGESEEQRRKRRHTPLGAEKYAVGPTYTFDFHTMYVDLTRWETANLPGGLNAMDLASFFDSLPLRLVAYDVKAAAAERSDSHLQRDKDYLFSFEVKYDKRRRHLHNDYELMTTEEAMRERAGRAGGRVSSVSGTGLSLLGSEMSTMSTTLSDASSLTEEDPVLAQEHAAFLRLEHARRLGQLCFSYLCWMEEVDVASDVRRVHYVFVVKDKVDEYDEGVLGGDDELDRPQHNYRLAIVSSYELRNMLQGRHSHKGGKAAEELAKMRFHSRSRIGSYSTISAEAHQVVMHLQSLAAEQVPASALPSYSSDCPSDTDTLDGLPAGDDRKTVDDGRLVAAQAALYKCLMKRQRLQESYTPRTKLSPSRIGVNLSRRDREDMGVVFEGVAYRYYAAELLRQEVLLLTKDSLQFYRSYSSSPEKQVPCAHVIGARAVEIPSCAAFHISVNETNGAFALQISTFAEEIVLCVGKASTRDAWVRGVLQYCNPKANFDRALQGEMYIGFAATTALRPANRVELNSRLLFPQLKRQTSASDVASNQEGVDTILTDTVPGALQLVKRTLKRAVHILNNVQHLSVTDVLAFLDDASELRAVDLQLLQNSGSHEEQVAFYLNLYHTVLAHAMIAQGFPRGKGQWSHFLMRTCYALSRGPGGEQVSVSLAEIEHVILRARLPRAELPHLSVNSVMNAANRLRDLGIAHPDFRLSLALVMNHAGSDEIVVFEPESVHDQLNTVLRSLLKRSAIQGHLEMKEDSNTIMLPRVFEWYRHDFSGAARARTGERTADASATDCVRKLLGFMDEKLQLQVISALGLDDTPLHTKYRSFKYTPKTSLVEDESCRPEAFEDTEGTNAAEEEGGGMTQL